jgi:indolepyruvate ferredoxin oxidoreductase, beta subunit
VTPDKTTLIASTRRAYAVAEKEKPGDGAGDPFIVVGALDFAGGRTIAFDMEKLAVERGTMISAACSARLRVQARSRSSGRLTETSCAKGRAARTQASPPLPTPTIARALANARRRRPGPRSARPLAFAGLKRIVDFQDVAYGDDYIDRLQRVAGLDAANGGAAKNFAFTAEAAKRLAVAMAHDDVIRVADIKVRPSRFTRLREEAGAAPDQLVYATEYLHPRGEEICGMTPASLGAFIEARPSLFQMLDRIVNRGRRVPIGRIFGFLPLYCVAALKPTRRSSLRHKRETRIWKRGSRKQPTSCRRTMILASRSCAATGSSRVIPTRMRGG